MREELKKWGRGQDHYQAPKPVRKGAKRSPASWFQADHPSPCQPGVRYAADLLRPKRDGMLRLLRIIDAEVR